MNQPPPRENKPQVVIVGVGFGGLNAARAFNHAEVEITVVDRRNHHLFQPLLYQVATAGLSPGDIAYPIRAVLSRQENTRVLLEEVLSVDLASRKVVLRGGELKYDYLILATGASHAYFGHDDWAKFAPGLKSLEDALEIRRRILLAFEKAERATDAAKRAELLTFVIVGGGPTGVELAAPSPRFPDKCWCGISGRSTRATRALFWSRRVRGFCRHILKNFQLEPKHLSKSSARRYGHGLP